MRAPEFWRRESAWSSLLDPIGRAYAAAGRVRAALTTPWRAPIPVICVGNLVAGGAGKTPTAISIAALLREAGRNVHFLSRGYGGRLRGPIRVNDTTHGVGDVGDEALLLATVAATWVSRDRRRGTAAAAAAGAEIIVMDDGFQNPSLIKDVSFVVVDGGYGFGNRRLIPAGPLREPIGRGLARATAAVLIGGDDAACAAHVAEHGLPLLRARLAPHPDSHGLAGKAVFAFAGIGLPEKFFATLSEIGCRVVARRSFPDHHPFTPDEIMAICEEATSLGALPVTTAKDAVRLPAEARPMVKVVRVGLIFEDPSAVTRLLRPALDRVHP